MGNLVSRKLVNGADVSSAAFCQSEYTDWEFCLYRGVEELWLCYCREIDVFNI